MIDEQRPARCQRPLWIAEPPIIAVARSPGRDPKRSLSVGAIGMLQLAQRLAEKLHNLARQLRLKGLAVEVWGILRRGAEPGAKFRDRRRYERIVARARGEACSRGWKLLAQVF